MLDGDSKSYSNLFFYILLVLVIVVGFFCYYRFMIKHDYVVSYNGLCDSTSQKCFINCSDDACSQISYYSEVKKYAPDLFNECGSDITNCTDSNICLPNDYGCSITYCDKSIGGNNCSVPVEATSSISGSSTKIFFLTFLQPQFFFFLHLVCLCCCITPISQQP